MRKAILAVVLAVFATGPFGKSAEMKRYVNSGLGFELSYPASYRATELPCGVARWYTYWGFQNLRYLSTGTGHDKGNIFLILDRRPFSLATLEATHAPTGWDEPHKMQVGKHTFFFYGAGGGGVAYPDQYFYDLNGLTLEVKFDGPYPPFHKSPSEETRQVEKKVLKSFRVFTPTVPDGK